MPPATLHQSLQPARIAFPSTFRLPITFGQSSIIEMSLPAKDVADFFGSERRTETGAEGGTSPSTGLGASRRVQPGGDRNTGRRPGLRPFPIRVICVICGREPSPRRSAFSDQLDEKDAHAEAGESKIRRGGLRRGEPTTED